MNEEEIWNSLKKKVLSLSGIESIEPKDCKILAAIIAKECKKNISETTFKRIYGFANAHFEASTRTKNILSQFCGYDNWESYRLLFSEKLAHERKNWTSWKKMKAETDKVNSFMLNAVKNKAVIPFNKMIERKSVHHHFEEFDQSNAIATVISAPTGYGKTIAVCQWLIEQLNAKNGNDLYLYLNSSFLLSSLKTVANLNYWMMKMIGLTPSDNFQKLLFSEKKENEKFYFIIDGFDEWMFRKNQFEQLSNLLLDILSIYKLSKWFKVIVLMRDSTWLAWRNQLMISPTSWYIGQMNDRGRNIGLFTPAELNILMKMQRPFTKKEICDEDFISLRLPIFHSYFFRKYNSIIKYEQFDEVLLFELASDYMNQNIINSSHTLAKMDFIFYILHAMDFLSGSYKAEKSRLKIHQKGFLNTYLDLIQMGFIGETEIVSFLNKKVYLHFAHLHLMGCCIAAFLLKEDSAFSIMKLEYIQQRWNMDSKLKINILKWCLFQMQSAEKRKDWIEGYQEYLDLEHLQELENFISILNTRPVK